MQHKKLLRERGATCNLAEVGGGVRLKVLLDFLSVPLKCRPGARSAGNVTNFHNLGHTSSK